MTERLDVDVLVVGAGPVGLTAALLLDRLGCSVAVVERRDGPQRAPAAHVVNARTFEIWRQLGLDVDGLRALALSPERGGAVHWVSRLGGRVLGSLPFERQGDDALSVTPTPLRNLSQHHLEPRLAAALADSGVRVRYGHAWRASEATGDDVHSTVEAPAGEMAVRSRWLLACDGASSPVRRSLGIEPVGPHHLQTFLMVHFAADLGHLTAGAPGVLYWVCDPAVGGTFVAHAGDEWVYMQPVDPGTDASEFPDARAERAVRAALAEPDVTLTIRSTSTWTMTAQVAERYRSGRAFLVGDAAHRFPPTGGLGLNTGVQDAHNLAWKLAAVVHGRAGDVLLDSYEAERRPVAQFNADTSLANAMKLVEVPMAIGDDLGAVLEDPVRMATVRAAIANQATHFDMLGLQLGYRYGEGASGLATGEADEGIRSYVPTAAVGARLPHAWVRIDGAERSTLDLVPVDRAVLIAGPACELRDADVRLGVDVEGAELWWRDVVGLPDRGALLVRPDQHVAARWDCAPSADGLDAVLPCLAP